jgi:hypothetical protein
MKKVKKMSRVKVEKVSKYQYRSHHHWLMRKKKMMMRKEKKTKKEKVNRMSHRRTVNRKK